MSAIGGFIGVHIHDVERVLVSWIGDHVHVVPRPLPETVAGIHELPALPAIIGAIQSALCVVSFDKRVHAIGVRAHRDANLSVRPLWQSVLFEPFPGGAAVARAIKPAARASAGHAPRGAPDRKSTRL